MEKLYKLLYVGVFKGFWVSDHYRLSGFKKVFDTEHFDFRNNGNDSEMMDELIKLIVEFSPDIIFINKGERLTGNFLERIKNYNNDIMIAVFNGDQRGFLQENTAKLALNCDILLLNNKDINQWNEYYDYGVCNIKEYHTATDISTYRKINKFKKYHIIFIGGNYNSFPLSKFRYNCIKELSKKFEVAVAGNNWKYIDGVANLGKRYGNEFAISMAESHMSLGISAYDNINSYTSNRTWNSISCGIPYICHYYSGIERFFNDKQIVMFKNINELLTKVKNVLDNYYKYEKLAINGMDYVTGNHTYYHRALELLDIYEEWKVERKY